MSITTHFPLFHAWKEKSWKKVGIFFPEGKYNHIFKVKCYFICEKTSDKEQFWTKWIFFSHQRKKFILKEFFFSSLGKYMLVVSDEVQKPSDLFLLHFTHEKNNSWKSLSPFFLKNEKSCFFHLCNRVKKMYIIFRWRKLGQNFLSRRIFFVPSENKMWTKKEISCKLKKVALILKLFL